MPRFRYTAANAQGKTVRGVTDAPSEEALYTKLRDDGLYMTDAQEAQKSHSAFRPLKTAMLADFCRNLGTLLAAGVPLVRAIRIMADERNIDARQKALYEAILGELRKGVPLSDAMEPADTTQETLLILGGRILLAQPKVRRQWDRFILHAPVVGVLNRKICTARFASTLSNLYGSGVPILTTLGAARDAIGNRWIESQFGDALDSIRAGHSLSQAIAGIDGFETKLSSSIAVGEETGRLDSLLAAISETLDYEAEMATKRLVTLLEPVMIVIMGIVVGGVVAAVIVPIYQSYGTIGGSSGAI